MHLLPTLSRTERKNERAQLAEHHQSRSASAEAAEPVAPEAFAGTDWTAEAEAYSTIPCSR